jgi:RNA polymerase sigma-70 factor (ECF subfamily)
LRSGDPEAFMSVVETYRNRVVGTCFRFLRNREDAEETAQDVFVEVYRSIDRFREEASLSTWIYRIAINKSLDILRKKGRKKRSPAGSLAGPAGPAGLPKEPAAPEEANPEKRREREERMRLLQEAVDALPRRQRIALTLAEFEGLPNREVAAVLGVSLSSVESLKHRAYKNLRKKLARAYRGLWDTKFK